MVFKNYKFRKKLENINFHLKKRKTGNSAKFRPDSQKRTSDSDLATKNCWESVKIGIDGIFDQTPVDHCNKSYLSVNVEYLGDNYIYIIYYIISN